METRGKRCKLVLISFLYIQTRANRFTNPKEVMQAQFIDDISATALQSHYDSLGGTVCNGIVTYA